LFLTSIKSRFPVALLHSHIESALSNIPSDFQPNLRAHKK
jgi:hypothetical protein